MKPTAAAFVMGLAAGWAMGPSPHEPGEPLARHSPAEATHDFEALEVAPFGDREEQLATLRAELTQIEALRLMLGQAPEPYEVKVLPSDLEAQIPLAMPR